MSVRKPLISKTHSSLLGLCKGRHLKTTLEKGMERFLENNQFLFRSSPPPNQFHEKIKILFLIWPSKGIPFNTKNKGYQEQGGRRPYQLVGGGGDTQHVPAHGTLLKSVHLQIVPFSMKHPVKRRVRMKKMFIFLIDATRNPSSHL